MCDFLAGIHLCAGILGALVQRERTGKGQRVEIAMHEAAVISLASALGAVMDGDQNVPDRTGNRHPALAMAPYNTYRCSDGYVAIFTAAAVSPSSRMASTANSPSISASRSRSEHGTRDALNASTRPVSHDRCSGEGARQASISRPSIARSKPSRAVRTLPGNGTGKFELEWIVGRFCMAGQNVFCGDGGGCAGLGGWRRRAARYEASGRVVEPLLVQKRRRVEPWSITWLAGDVARYAGHDRFE